MLSGLNFEQLANARLHASRLRSRQKRQAFPGRGTALLNLAGGVIGLGEFELSRGGLACGSLCGAASALDSKGGVAKRFGLGDAIRQGDLREYHAGSLRLLSQALQPGEG